MIFSVCLNSFCMPHTTWSLLRKDSGISLCTLVSWRLLTDTLGSGGENSFSLHYGEEEL